ncbi:hypothetical protein DL96DRAFT_559388 [Flagelloscypha sp. PMI_526]|nr:hypothetical protein DL96DRAFT_559388 [Flagelloscypha sp. PMI_526]
MSFVFHWPRFSDQFHYDAIQMLNNALNKGKKPPVIADKIEVVELEMGTQPPELDIREIGELTMDQFRGIFRLTYSGDAHIVLKTKVQANPLNHKSPEIHHLAGSSGMLAASQPLVVPMLLRLSNFELASIVVLVVSKQKGITLVFKTDPLKRVDISSTFDSIEIIQKFIQKEIENQLKQVFREDLPSIIHRLSQTWVKSKVDAPNLTKQPSASEGTTRHHPLENVSFPAAPQIPSRTHSLEASPALRPQLNRPYALSTTGVSLAGRTDTRGSTASLKKEREEHVSEKPPPTFPDLEEYDPTYGLRPEGVPYKSPFRGFGALFQPDRGLADLREEASHEDLDYDEDDYGESVSAASFDVVDWTNGAATRSQGSISPEPSEMPYEFEQFPAVGGGVITRPRIIQSQSISPGGLASPLSPFPGRPGAFSSRLSRSNSATQIAALRPPLSHHGSVQHNPYFSPAFVGSTSRWSPPRQTAYSSPAPLNTPIYRSTTISSPEETESSLETPPSFSYTANSNNRNLSPPSIITTPPSIAPTHSRSHSRTRPRRSSLSSMSQDDSSTFDHHGSSPRRKIVLRPSMLTLNNSIQQLTTLSNSNHTLSPYTRSLEHFTVRSGPPRPPKSSSRAGGDMPLPVKARRKRTVQMGKKKSRPTVAPFSPDNEEGDEKGQESGYYSDSSLPQSPVPPSEFDAMDMAHYFRTSPALRKRRP